MVITLPLFCMELKKTRNFSLYNINISGFVTEEESVCCAVHTEFLNNSDMFRLYRVYDALVTSINVFRTDLVS